MTMKRLLAVVLLATVVVYLLGCSILEPGPTCSEHWTTEPSGVRHTDLCLGRFQ